MGQKGNLLLVVVLLISFLNIMKYLGFPLAIIFTSVLILAVHFRESLIIIYKTLPRDLNILRTFVLIVPNEFEKEQGFSVRSLSFTCSSHKRCIPRFCLYDCCAINSWPNLAIRILYLTSHKLKKCEEENWTAIDLFREHVKKNPEKVCIYFEDQKWTFQDIEDFSNKVANVFQEAGLKKGDIVALLMGNCPEYACLWLGLGKIGVVTSLININLRNDSLLHCLRVAQAKTLIFADEYISVLEEISDNLEGIAKYQYPCQIDCPNLKIKNLKNLIDSSLTVAPVVNENISFRDKAVYIYTSGTTGLPKPAIIPHHRLILMSLVSLILGIKTDDIVYNPLPLYHTAGGMLGITGPLCNGHSVVIRKKFSSSSYWPDCIKYNCTASQYIGEMCRYVQMVPPRSEDASHKVRLVFGNGMRANIMEVFQSRFKIDRIVELYGSTEGNTNIVNIDGKIGAVGFLPKILPASFLPMALIKVNEEGEAIRGKDGYCMRCKPHEPGMFIGMILSNDSTREYSGYVGSATENQKKIIENVFKKGDKAFLSGDILVMDELGYLYFKDRTGDTFRWKGENVSTTEVEETLAAVIGLREVTVYGVEVGNLEGRAGMATVVDPKGEINVQFLHSELSRRLPSYARPLFLRLTSEASMTATYKLKKVDLQKEGFNPSVIKDRLYFNNSTDYIQLTQDIYDQIINGIIRI